MSNKLNFETQLQYEEDLFEQMKKIFGFSLIISHWHDVKIIALVVNYCSAMSQKNRKETKKHFENLKKHFQELNNFYMSLIVEINNGKLVIKE